MARLFLTLYLALVGSVFGLFFSIDYLSTRHFYNEQIDGLSRQVTAYQGLFNSLYQHAGNEVMFQQMQQALSIEGMLVEHVNDPSILPRAAIILDAGKSYSHFVGGDFETYFKSPDNVSFYLVSKDEKSTRWRAEKTLANIYLFGFFLMTALVLAGWIYLLQRKLKLLEVSAQRIAQGDFSARAPRSASASVGGLNQAFNLMAERIEKLIASHKRLTNAVAHELRTPIFRLRCQAALLEFGIAKHEHDGYIQGIDQDLTELDQLVDEMLQCARMERCEEVFKFGSYDLGAWLSEHRALLTRSCHKAIEIHKGDRVTLRFDEAQILRALTNVVRNADKYAQSAIDISFFQRDSYLVICVDDDGAGIPSTEVERIVEPFERLDNARTRRVGGHGLGLSIVREITRQHRGKLCFERSPLGGARVMMFLAQDL